MSEEKNSKLSTRNMTVQLWHPPSPSATKHSITDRQTTWCQQWWPAENRLMFKL